MPITSNPGVSPAGFTGKLAAMRIGESRAVVMAAAVETIKLISCS
jgi:hypothetical protein